MQLLEILTIIKTETYPSTSQQTPSSYTAVTIPYKYKRKKNEEI